MKIYTKDLVISVSVSRQCRVVYQIFKNNLLCPQVFLVALALSNGRISETENAFSGLVLLEKYLWSMLPPEAMLLYIVHAIARTMLMSVVCCRMY